MALGHGSSIVRNGLVLHLDAGNFAKGVSKTQLIPNPNFEGDTVPYRTYSAFTNENYLGDIVYGTMTGNSVIFSGGDGANYSVSNPSLWGWDNGFIGSTGGNWKGYEILNDTNDENILYAIKVRWRFYYISKTGQGTTNPKFQIGANYQEKYGKFYNEVGNDWVEDTFIMNAADFTYPRNELTFGCTSADSAVEISLLECHEILRNNFINDLRRNFNVSGLNGVSYKDNLDSLVFDGTNDYLSFGNQSINSLLNSDNPDQITLSIMFTPYSRRNHALFNMGPALRFGMNSDGTFGGLLFYKDGSWRNAGGVNYLLVENNTYHIVATYNNRLVEVYINGEFISSSSFDIDWPNTSTYATEIGAYLSSASMYGETHKFMIYNRALTEAEIQQNFEALRGRYGI